MITVTELWVEVLCESSETPAEALEKWRRKKALDVAAQVEAVLTQTAREKGKGERSGLVARIGHMALKQLRIRIERVLVRIHPHDGSAEPLDFCCDCLALRPPSLFEGNAVSSLFCVPPPETKDETATLSKVLELRGLCLRISFQCLVEFFSC